MNYLEDTPDIEETVNLPQLVLNLQNKESNLQFIHKKRISEGNNHYLSRSVPAINSATKTGERN